MSMEIRHLWPIYIVTILFGFGNLMSILLKFLNKIKIKYITLFFSIIFVSTILLGKNIPSEKHLEKIIFEKILNMKTDPVGMDVEINNYFVSYFKNKNNIKIKTNYTFLNMLSHPVIDNKLNEINYENPDYSNKTLLKNFNFDLLYKYCSKNFILNEGKNFKIIKNFSISNSCLLKNDN